jgi:hypothetical protein
MGQAGTSPAYVARRDDGAVTAGAVAGAGICPEIVAVPISSLRPADSPRLEGEDKAHIARLAAIQTPLPPVLVDRRTMRVIDGMHRLRAASLNGQDVIRVRFFDGNPADVFVHAVAANAAHGLPLSQADRRAAAERIVRSHPHLSDRAIAQAAGLAARTVAAIRRRAAGAAPRPDARVGRDGRVRPLSGVEGRRRVAALLAEHPRASLRAVAREAGVSPTTVRDVRRRLDRGEDAAPAGPGRAAGRDAAAGPAVTPGPRQAPAALLHKLLRDPSLRHNEQGRRLLRWLQHNPGGPQEWSGVIPVVSPHCAALVAKLAWHNAQMWWGFSQELSELARVTDPWADGQPASPPPVPPGRVNPAKSG